MTLARCVTSWPRSIRTSPSYVSVFAGRIADTGRDPVPMMAAAVELLKVDAGPS